MTSTTTLSADLGTKQLELLKEAVPRAVCVGVVVNPDNPWHPLAVQSAERAARSRLAELSTRDRLPTMHGVRQYVDRGGLMSYWAHQGDLYRRVASYVDRLFKGARAGDLPIEEPPRWDSS